MGCDYYWWGWIDDLNLLRQFVCSLQMVAAKKHRGALNESALSTAERLLPSECSSNIVSYKHTLAQPGAKLLGKAVRCLAHIEPDSVCQRCYPIRSNSLPNIEIELKELIHFNVFDRFSNEKLPMRGIGRDLGSVHCTVHCEQYNASVGPQVAASETSSKRML